jgi:hypothetical protein
VLQKKCHAWNNLVPVMTLIHPRLWDTTRSWCQWGLVWCWEHSSKVRISDLILVMWQI